MPRRPPATRTTRAARRAPEVPQAPEPAPAQVAVDLPVAQPTGLNPTAAAFPAGTINWAAWPDWDIRRQAPQPADIPQPVPDINGLGDPEPFTRRFVEGSNREVLNYRRQRERIRSGIIQTLNLTADRWDNVPTVDGSAWLKASRDLQFAYVRARPAERPVSVLSSSIYREWELMQPAPRVDTDEAMIRYQQAARQLRSRRSSVVPPPLGVHPVAPEEYKPSCKRGSATPRFFIHYETSDEWSRRLVGSYVTFKDAPVYVSVVNHDGGIVEGLTCYDVNGKVITIRIPKDEEFLNLRTIQPGYLDISSHYGGTYSAAGYLLRLPLRVFRQGICPENSGVYRAGETGDMTPINSFRVQDFLKTLSEADAKRPLNGFIIDGVDKSLRNNGHGSAALSRNFAYVRRNDENGKPEDLILYRNHPVGHLLPNLKAPEITTKLPKTLLSEAEELNLV